MSTVLDRTATSGVEPSPGGEDIDGSAAAARHRRRLRRAVIAVVLLLALVVVVVVLVVRRSPAPVAAPPPLNTAQVTTKTISNEESLDGTIGYAQARPVVTRFSGLITEMVPEGTVVNPGGELFRIDERPVFLLTGTLPAWRDLGPATTAGPDVQQLNQSLVALGYDPDKTITPDQNFSAATAAAVVRWQTKMGLEPTGTVGLGIVVFEPAAVTVGHHDVSVGTSVGAGATVIEARSSGLTMQFTVPATSTVSITIGQNVDVTLPDRSTGKGTITSIGTVTDATTGAVSTVGRGPVNPPNPTSANPADQAPIKVRVSQIIGSNVLTVPAAALTSNVDGTWVVTVVDASRATHDVAVKVGVSGGGSVAVSGDGIGPGTRVVIPSNV